MLKNYLKVAFRNLTKNKVYSVINIGGLAVGMAVAMLIGLWIFDELSYNKSHDNYNRIAKVWQFVKFETEKSSYDVMPIPVAEELRTRYPEFSAVSLSSQNQRIILEAGEKKLLETGNYVEPSFIDMMSVRMKTGDRAALKDMNAVLLSATLAKNFFGAGNPIDKLIKLNNKQTVKVAGVYEDFPLNSGFNNVHFLATWELYSTEPFIKGSLNEWDNNNWYVYAQLKEGADFDKVSAKIKDIRMKKENPPPYKPEFFLHPMSSWHLYSDFKDGVNTGGLIQFVWLFGIIGGFVLLLACINFMNLSTARSEKRAKEVGIRKAIGSVRRQLVIQFLSESLMISLIAFVLSLLLVQLTLPLFNTVSGKEMSILWSNPMFWMIGFGFTFLTGLIAGSYPSLYLSSFKAVKVLKGTFKAGRFAAIPRKVLVVLQFSVSVTLIIGTIVVFRQIQFAKDRPTGYSRNGLLEIDMNTPEIRGHYTSLRNDLLNTNAVYEFSESSSSITGTDGGTTDITWAGKAQDQRPLFMSNSITHDFGRTLGWTLVQGRDFSRNFSTDTASIILNEASAKLIGFKNPLGEIVKVSGKSYRVIGITKNIVKESPFSPVTPSFYLLNYQNVGTIQIKLSPKTATGDALAKVAAVFARYDPASPFDYRFVNENYSKKFSAEERIGKLASFFTILAVFISCLGLFGLASFVAEQRGKEIGVRKVLGATIFNVWRLLSKEFILLVTISLFIAVPTAWYFMHSWLQNYEYRAELSWWIFAAAGAGAIFITIATVSFQAIKAALLNPVKTLRSE